MSRGSGILRVLAVCVVVGGLVGAAEAVPRSSDPEQSNEAAQVPVAEATLTCPERRQDVDDTDTTVGALAVPGDDDSADGDSGDGAGQQDGALRIAPLGPGARSDAEGADTPVGVAGVDQRGARAAQVIDGGNIPPLVARADGALAPGVTAGQLTRATSGALRGFAETPCVHPDSEYWFVGAGSELGRQGLLYLTNAEDTEARVDVELFDEDGPIGSDATRNVSVEPQRQRVVALDEIAPTSERLAVRVEVTEGRATAALRDHTGAEGVPLGTDWIPASQPPSRDVVVPAVAPGEGRRVLTVAAPTDTTASVDLSISGADGTFSPMAMDQLDVGPGSVAEIDLTEATGSQAAAVRLEADEPVVASVRHEFGRAEADENDAVSGEDPAEVAFSSAAQPWEETVAVPVTPTDEDTEARLLLTAVDESPGRATVRMLDADGTELGRDRVDIPPAGTTEHTVQPPENVDHYTLLVTPEGDTGLVGGRLLVSADEDGPLVSLWPLQTTPRAITQPPAFSTPHTAGR